MLKALPGEFKAQGHRSRRHGVSVRFAAGEGIEPALAQRLQAFFDHPWYTILNKMGSEQEPFPAFLEELRTRQYDLATLRFSVFLKSAGRKVARNPSRIPQVPGLLHARWAGVEYDVPDVCSCWHRPCHRGDSRLFQCLLSTSSFTKEELAAASLRDISQPHGLLDVLRQHGFDERTLRFRVHSALPLHPDDIPAPKEVSPEKARLVRLHEDDCPAFVKRCPACGATHGQACSVPDPDHEGLGIELGNQVHAGRLA